MARPTHNVVATIGEYKNGAGETKKRYITCGKYFVDEQGRQSIKMDSIPGPGWSGWFSLYPIDPDPADAPPPRRQNSAPAPTDSPPDEDDEIPF